MCGCTKKIKPKQTVKSKDKTVTIQGKKYVIKGH